MAGIVDNKVGLAKLLELLLGGADEHIVHEESVVGSCADHSDLDAVLGIPLENETELSSHIRRNRTKTHAGEAIEDVDEVTGVQVVDCTFAVDFKRVFVHFDVDWTPPDVILARFFEDDTLVLRTATGLLAGKVDECTGSGNDGTLVPDSILV